MKKMSGDKKIHVSAHVWVRLRGRNVFLKCNHLCLQTDDVNEIIMIDEAHGKWAQNPGPEYVKQPQTLLC